MTVQKLRDILANLDGTMKVVFSCDSKDELYDATGDMIMGSVYQDCAVVTPEDPEAWYQTEGDVVVCLSIEQYGTCEEDGEPEEE